MKKISLMFLGLLLSAAAFADSVPSEMIGTWTNVQPTGSANSDVTSVVSAIFSGDKKMTWRSHCDSPVGSADAEVSVGVEFDLSKKSFVATNTASKRVYFDGGRFCYAYVTTAPVFYDLQGSKTLLLSNDEAHAEQAILIKQ